jgi:hypothetical protein|tara:strand:+ start:327 stop:851 length:525 start_codon:yes stop_codon:yes gene_type:complete
MLQKKNMKLGKVSFILLVLNIYSVLIAEDKITSVPLINLENLKPSFEKEDINNENPASSEAIILKEKKVLKIKNKITKVNIVALDKITAKTSDISILLGETKKFGLLEIKALQCGNVESKTEQGQAAYIQVKDLSDNNSNQVFVFNGWTFSHSTTLRPVEHAIYDFWLISCDNV